MLQYSQAVLVLRECMHLEADNAVVPLLIAKVCYEHLHRVSWKTDSTFFKIIFSDRIKTNINLYVVPKIQ